MRAMTKLFELYIRDYMGKSLTKTLIIQSHTEPFPFDWLEVCTHSVESWSKTQDYEYRFYGDELFDRVDPKLVDKFSNQKVIITDLARLLVLKEALNEGYDRAIWLDADVLVFAPNQFKLPELWDLPEGYMVGREVWVQSSLKTANKLSAHVKVHNAFLLFDRGNSFLDFYIDQAERFLHQCQGSVPPQFIGPKLLTALHNVIQCPVMDSAGMLSPEVIKALLSSDKPSRILELFRKKSPQPIAAANLCSSLAGGIEVSNKEIETLVDKLLGDALPI